MDDEELDALLKNERYPRPARYSARWMVDAAMGPNPVWQAEALSDLMHLEAGMRVLDMGCGAASSSIFLAKEFGVEVWATDLWVTPTDNLRRVTGQGLQDRVHPISAEAHGLPFTVGFFDALVSFDAYHYFGTDDLYLGYYSRYVTPGGQIGIVVPGLAEELQTLPPPHLAPYWKWDFCSFHSPDWWRRHWEKTGLVSVEVADSLREGWRDWLTWNEGCDRVSGTPGEEAAMLRTDDGRHSDSPALSPAATGRTRHGNRFVRDLATVRRLASPKLARMVTRDDPPGSTLAAVRIGTRLLLSTTGGLTEADVRRPSLLPDWSRGHVLSHLINNAEGGARLLEGVASGVPGWEYVDLDSRAADIERGSHAPIEMLVSRLEMTAQRFDEACTARLARPVVDTGDVDDGTSQRR